MIERYVAGLDIGTSKISLMVAKIREGEPLEVVAVGKAPSTGLKKGVVVDIPKTVQSISDALEAAEEDYGRPIEDVFVGVAGAHVTCLTGSAKVALAEGVGTVDEKVLSEAVRAATPDAPAGKELIHSIPIDFIVDGVNEIDNPLGLHADEVQVEVNAVYAATAAIRNLVGSVAKAGLTVSDIILEPLASGAAVLNEEERDVGVALLDVGAGTTDLALFKGGKMVHSHIIPVGGDHLTNDLSVALGVSRNVAESIKKRDGSAHRYLVDAMETVQVDRLSHETTTASRAYIAEVLELRLAELFRLVAGELRSQGLRSVMPAGLVLTGGTSNLPAIELLAQDVLGIPCRLGRPSGLTGMGEVLSDAIFATGIGLILEGAEKVSAEPEGIDVRNQAMDLAGGFLEKLKSRISAWFGLITEDS